MVYPITYRRPDYVPRSRGSVSGSIESGKSGKSDDSDKSNESGSSSFLKTMPLTPAGIPEALSFDKVISGGCCPPCTKREFLNYLKYIERAPENLQFFLWFRDYEKRFNELPESEKSLAPAWTEAQVENERKEYRARLKQGTTNQTEKELFRGTDFEKSKTPDIKPLDPCPFDDRCETPGSAPRDTMSTSDDASSAFRPTTGGMRSVMTARTAQTQADSAFEEVGLNKPFTVQPYREEISRIITVYITESAPRQLNLSGRELHALLKALEYTTHPSAFREAANTVEYSLRRQAHPNFIRWAICNGNRPRVVFARGLGAFLIVAAIVTDILIALSSVARAWRVLPMILSILGFATLIAAWKGMCVVLHGLHHQHVRPWELFAHNDDDHHGNAKLDDGERGSGSFSEESLYSASANSFEDEPWVAKYGKRNVVRQVFDREVWIQEPALRQIQDTIFVQALLMATAASAVIVAIFVAVPKGNIL